MNMGLFAIGALCLFLGNATNGGFMSALFYIGGSALIIGGFINWMSSATATEKMHENINSNRKIKDSKYKHTYRTSGIGVDVENKLVHLINNNLEKTYSFSDIRNWRTNLASGGGIVGGMATTGGMAGTAQNLQVLAANRRAQKENISESGLFIEVKDIENPLWQIMFEHDKKINLELARWMEILNQCIGDKNN